MAPLRRVRKYKDGPWEVLFRDRDVHAETLKLVQRTSDLEDWAKHSLKEDAFKWSSDIDKMQRPPPRSEEQWMEYASSHHHRTPDFGNQARAKTEMVGQNEPVLRITLQSGKVWYLRDAIAETLFVDEVSQLLGMDFSARTSVGRAPGGSFFGVLSEEVPGQVYADYLGSIDEGSLNDAITMSYLLGLGDAHKGNFKVDGSGCVRGFDFNPVNEPFSTSAVSKLDRYKAGKLAFMDHFGKLLPPRYKRAFLEKLRVLTPNEILQKWSSLFSKEEIQAFLIRREIILHDATDTSKILN